MVQIAYNDKILMIPLHSINVIEIGELQFNFFKTTNGCDFDIIEFEEHYD